MKQKPLNKFLVAISLLGILASSSFAADPLIEWNIDGYSNNGVPPNDVPPDLRYATFIADNVTATSWTLNNGAALNQGGNVFAVQNWSTLSSFDPSEAYVSFTLSAQPGFELNLTSLQYSSRRVSAILSTPTTGLWGYRIDGGSWVTQTPQALGTTNFNSTNMLTWDFDDFSSSGTVEFAFWAYGAGASTDPARVISRIDAGASPGLIVKGSAISAVPEPSAYGIIIGLSVISLAFTRRMSLRRQTNS